MENLPFILLALACPLGMGLMMLFMGKGMMGMGHADKQEPDTIVTPSADPEKRLALLQAQRQLLDAQIASMDTEREADSVSRDESAR